MIEHEMYQANNPLHELAPNKLIIRVEGIGDDFHRIAEVVGVLFQHFFVKDLHASRVVDIRIEPRDTLDYAI